tara:strand:+ start:27370 stop:27543 length:174 start_codon:yes stop_codon:yes gene_type:complete
MSLQAGISGSEKERADSTVLSSRYEDDEDFGHEIFYTDAGGQDDRNNLGSGSQIYSL